MSLNETRKWLRERHSVEVRGHMTHLGENAIPFQGFEHVDANPFFVANQSIVADLEALDAAGREIGGGADGNGILCHGGRPG